MLDLHAIVSKDGFITINDAQIFIRNDCGLYDIVYERKFIPKIESFSDMEDDGDYCSQSLSKHDLVSLIRKFA